MKKYIVLLLSLSLIACSGGEDEKAPIIPNGDNGDSGGGDSGPTTPTSCGVDLYLDGDSCVAVSVGEYSADGDASKHSCTNKGANADSVTYTSTGGGINNCSHDIDSCVSEYLLKDGACVSNLIFEDDFSGLPPFDGTTELVSRSGWLDDPLWAYSIMNQFLVNGDSVLAHKPEPGIKNFIKIVDHSELSESYQEITFNIEMGATLTSPGIVIRYSEAQQDGYACILENDGTDTYVRVVTFGTSGMATAPAHSGIPWTPLGTNTLGCEDTGTGINIYINGVMVDSYTFGSRGTDPNISQGLSGITGFSDNSDMSQIFSYKLYIERPEE